MAYRSRVARARTSHRPSSAEAGEVREIVHDLHNNLAAMHLWLSTLLEEPCPRCQGRREEVAAGIRRNLTSMLAASRRLTTHQKEASRVAPRSGAGDRVR